jgi:transposase
LLHRFAPRNASLSQVQIRYLAAPEPVQKMHARLLKKIALEVAKLEAAIADLVKATPHLTELAEIIETVPGLGAVTSASG